MIAEANEWTERAIAVNREWKSQFDQNGFVVIPRFFEPDEIKELEAGLARFLRDVAPQASKAEVMYEDPANPASLKQANCLQREPSFHKLMHATGKARGLAELLIGPAAPQQCEYFGKPPGHSTPTPPHQDGFYFCLEPNLACTLWIPLDVVDADNGALSYVRGSHRLGVLPHRVTSVLGFSQGLVPDPADLGEAVLCAARPGDILVHHSLTIHYAGSNRSERHRRSIGCVFFSEAAKPDEPARERYQAALQSQHEAKGIVAPAVSP